jgi:hypothetical protein
MRAQAQHLLDHACKALSADDLERCRSVSTFMGVAKPLLV